MKKICSNLRRHPEHSEGSPESSTDLASEDPSSPSPRDDRKAIGKVFILCTCILFSPVLLSTPPEKNKLSLLESLIGHPDDRNKIYLGMLLFHSRSYFNGGQENILFRENAGLTFKGFYFSYFKNTFQDDTFTLGLERIWFKSESRDNLYKVDAGYRIGAMYGYCFPKDKYSFLSVDSLTQAYGCDGGTVKIVRLLPMVFLEGSYKSVGLSANLTPGTITLHSFFSF